MPQNSQTRVLLIANSSSSFMSHRFGLYQALVAKGFKVNVVIPEVDGIPSANIDLKKNIVLVNLKRNGMNPLNDIYTFYTLVKVIKRLKPDILHNFTMKPVIYGSSAGLFCKVPKIINSITGLGYVFTSNAAAASILRPFIITAYKTIFKSSKIKVICQNSDDLKYLEQKKIIHRNRTYIVPGSGVNIQTFSPTPSIKKISGVVTITCVARLLREKGIYELAIATNILNKTPGLPPFKIQIVGGRDHANPGSLKDSTIEKWRNIPNLIFLGERNDIPTILNSSDIFCLPSHREGLPMSTLEAMASGLPIVTTDAPGCKETIVNGENGILVPSRNAIELAIALESMISNSNLRAAQGKKSRILAESLFSIESISEQIVKIYESP